MRSKATILVGVILAIVLLIVLNAASYAPIIPKPDTEFSASRSTFNAGAGGCKALYDFLAESGYRVSRWREPLKGLILAGHSHPDTLVIIGTTKIPLESEETELVRRWVAAGHKLVIIDRYPDFGFMSEGAWRIALTRPEPMFINPRSDDLRALTENVEMASPVQPTPLTRGVNSVQPSRLAALMIAEMTNQPGKKPTEFGTTRDDEDENADNSDTPPKKEPTPPVASNKGKSPGSGIGSGHGGFGPDIVLPPSVPVVEMATKSGALVLNWKLGKGTVTVMGDPFIVSNTGLSLADNLQLAVNLLGDKSKLVAFDEFHQGQSEPENEIAAYFKGTPVLPITFQIGFVLLLLLWTGAKRFARPLPRAGLDRRSSLEFVGSMAELQQRARAYDLAIENVYVRIRRQLVRYAGASFDLPRNEIAARVAERSGLVAKDIEELMRRCEAVINGERPGEVNALDIIRRLRRLERKLGLASRQRDIRQSAPADI